MRFSLLSFLCALAALPVLSASQPIVRSTPQSVRTLAPVYPFHLLIEGREGFAEVQFMIEYSGKAILPSVVGATDPAFAQALLAEIEANEFMPARVNGQPRLTPAQLKVNFAVTLDAAARQLLLELRKPMPALPFGDQLDKRPAPLRAEPPAYPYSLQNDGTVGRAEIEIVIDRTGRVLFPRVRAATNPEIGYAAMSVVSRWKFSPPTKDGQPVDARHLVTLNYDPIRQTVSW